MEFPKAFQILSGFFRHVFATSKVSRLGMGMAWTMTQPSIWSGVWPRALLCLQTSCRTSGTYHSSTGTSRKILRFQMILIQIPLVESRRCVSWLRNIQTQETCDMVSSWLVREKISPLARGIWRRDEIDAISSQFSWPVSHYIVLFKLVYPWLHIFFDCFRCLHISSVVKFSDVHVWLEAWQEVVVKASSKELWHARTVTYTYFISDPMSTIV